MTEPLALLKMVQPATGLNHLLLQGGGASLQGGLTCTSTWIFVHVDRFPSMFMDFHRFHMFFPLMISNCKKCFSLLSWFETLILGRAGRRLWRVGVMQVLHILRFFNQKKEGGPRRQLGHRSLATGNMLLFLEMCCKTRVFGNLWFRLPLLLQLQVLPLLPPPLLLPVQDDNIKAQPMT